VETPIPCAPLNCLANSGDKSWPDWRFFVFHFTIHLIQLLSESILDEDVRMSYPHIKNPAPLCNGNHGYDRRN
jgi:hypothetical protein